MELAFAGKDLMILVVYRHYIDFGIAVKVIQPIGPYTGWRKWNFPVSAQVRKNGPADILISKGYKLLFKIFFDLVHDEPGVIQFQFSLIRVDIPEPEAHKVILYEVKPFAGLLWIFLRHRRVLDDKAQIAEGREIRRQAGSLDPHSAGDFTQLMIALRYHSDNGKIVYG